MEYRERFSEEERKNSKRGLEVFDGYGNKYLIRLNNIGELTINNPDGKLIVMPCYSNEIIIKTD